MILSLGPFELALDWQGESLSFPAFERQEAENAGYSGERFMLHIEENAFPDHERAAEGWNGSCLDGMRRAVYVKNGKALFSLEYGRSEREATVRLQKPAGSRARLGIQYGMLTVMHRRVIGLHGVTLLCGDEIIILSAPSGTGKTTLAHLLETYCGAIVINGDFAMLSVCDEGVIFEPTPFCGTSGRCLNHRVRVNRVVFLEQAKTNQWRDLTGTEALIRFMSNAFIPTWDGEMRRTVQENFLQCMARLKANAFAFAPTKEAAETFFQQL